MTAQDAHAEAVCRIEQAHSASAEILDLGDLPLERLPDALAQLTDLHVLTLGNIVPRVQDNEIAWDWDEERSAPGFQDLTPLAQLSNLQQLNLIGCKSVTDVGTLVQLANIQY